MQTHMSVCKLADGNFVAIDAAVLSPKAKLELDELTDGGEKLVGCIMTHPFHTLAIPDFHAAIGAVNGNIQHTRINAPVLCGNG